MSRLRKATKRLLHESDEDYEVPEFYDEQGNYSVFCLF